MASEQSYLLGHTSERHRAAGPSHDHPSADPTRTTTPASTPQQAPDESLALHSMSPVPRERLKTVVTAYLMWFPFGLLGFHHFYLKNTAIGFNYLLTFGLFGFGWVVDFWRIPMLVDAANQEIEAKWIWEHEVCDRSTSDSTSEFKYIKPKRLSDCYILGFTTGFLGFHHHYLGRHCLGLLYLVTFGLFSVGYLTDWIRMPIHLQRYNERLASKVKGTEEPMKYHLDDAYVMAIPGGIFGFHHFYLGRYLWGFFYLFTLGVFGLGWLADLIRMPFLVEDANHRARSRLSMMDGIETGIKYDTFSDDVPRIDPYYSDYNSGQSHRSYSQSDTAPVSASVTPRSSLPKQPLSPRIIPKPQHFKEFKTETDTAASLDPPLPDHTMPLSPSSRRTPPPPYSITTDEGSTVANGEASV